MRSGPRTTWGVRGFLTAIIPGMPRGGIGPAEVLLRRRGGESSRGAILRRCPLLGRRGLGGRRVHAAGRLRIGAPARVAGVLVSRPRRRGGAVRPPGVVCTGAPAGDRPGDRRPWAPAGRRPLRSSPRYPKSPVEYFL